MATVDADKRSGGAQSTKAVALPAGENAFSKIPQRRLHWPNLLR
jgi:hypothetical protein